MLERDKEERRKNFVVESQLLHNAQTLCKSLISDHDKREVAFMDAVRVMLVRLDAKGTKISKHDINERIYQQLPGVSLQSIVDFERRYMANKPYRYVILGDEKELNMEAIQAIGPVKRVSTEEIFGY